MADPQGTFKLVTVNTSPTRARELIGRAVNALKDRYTILHVANCETIDAVEPVVKNFQPDLLFCASMWTIAERDEIVQIATEVSPGIKIHALPQGFQMERGPDAVVDYLLEKIPQILG